MSDIAKSHKKHIYFLRTLYQNITEQELNFRETGMQVWDSNIHGQIFMHCRRFIFLWILKK